MSASKMFKTLCGDLLRLSKKSSNFANTIHAERQAYNNLIRQQSILLDEYEELVQAYEDNHEGSADTTCPPDSNPVASTSNPPSMDT